MHFKIKINTLYMYPQFKKPNHFQYFRWICLFASDLQTGEEIHLLLDFYIHPIDIYSDGVMCGILDQQ